MQQSFRRFLRRSFPSLHSRWLRLRETLITRAWYHAEERGNRKKTVEEVFTDIYAAGRWGESDGASCSGDGSIVESVVLPYVHAVGEEAAKRGLLGKVFVDLGCGDFRVGRHMLPMCSSYIGVDVVRSLVLDNQKKFGSATTRFLHQNIVDDDIPDGDVCFLRQVLQQIGRAHV